MIGESRTYTAYSYLTPGADFRSFELAPEFGRVPAYQPGLTEQDQQRADLVVNDGGQGRLVIP